MDNAIHAVSSRMMCPCCCGGGKSDLSQWQDPQITSTKSGSGVSYDKLEWVCRRTGNAWQDEEAMEVTRYSRAEAEYLAAAAEEINEIFDDE